MKRLLRISFNNAIFSFIPVLSWMMLGIVLDKNLANVFTLTYPLQFIWSIMRGMFATGANINKEKDKKEDAVLSGMTIRNNCRCPSLFAYSNKYKELHRIHEYGLQHIQRVCNIFSNSIIYPINILFCNGKIVF